MNRKIVRFAIVFTAGMAFAVTGPRASVALTVQELAPGLYVLGSSDRFGSANVGWVIQDDNVLLIGAPHSEIVKRALVEIRKQSDKPVREVIFTHVGPGEVGALPALARAGITVLVHHDAAKPLRDAADSHAAGPDRLPEIKFREIREPLILGNERKPIHVLTPMRTARPGNTAVFFPDSRVLFAGEQCIHGPRAALAGRNTTKWLESLHELRSLAARRVVPGFGSPGGPEILERQERFLRELRRQVAYLTAQGRFHEDAVSSVRLAPEWLVCMPYDQPTKPDVEHVFRELTVPEAPFATMPFDRNDTRPKALALISDRNHDPAHLEAGLSRAFAKAGIDARFAFDVRALTAENLKAVRLFVILRDGVNWPIAFDGPSSVWMTPAQEKALTDFVDGGGGVLVLHNAMGLYPEGGPYLKLAGGTYQGHGPLERFRVNVINKTHPITNGVADFEVADEQHTPTPDKAKVELLLESRSDEGTIGAAGWCYTSGQGRVCYLANGHTREAQFHPEFQKLLRNAMTWCAGSAAQ